MCCNKGMGSIRYFNRKSDMRCLSNKRYRGFSFVEIMAVVIIIGILAGAVAFKFKNYIDKSKVNRAKGDMATLVTAIESYYADKGKYPSNDDGLDVLNITTKNDPWGRPYQYYSPGREGDFDIICLGRDGMEGGEGIDADINSWELGQVQEEDATIDMGK